MVIILRLLDFKSEIWSRSMEDSLQHGPPRHWFNFMFNQMSVHTVTISKFVKRFGYLFFTYTWFEADSGDSRNVFVVRRDISWRKKISLSLLGVDMNWNRGNFCCAKTCLYAMSSDV